MSRDQYEVLEPLGSGAYGSVFKIRRKSDDKTLVWKEINFGTMCEKEKSQLVAEVNILREMRNPFVVRYHDRIVDKPRTRLYIIMEYCQGGDLSRIIQKCKRDRANLDESLIWKILAQSVLALKDCHRRQENGETRPILHRDLKPANILLDGNQNIKMGDFGLAKELSSQSRLAQTNVGTPFYMAPEIINEKDYDEKSDIWALGCLIYELAALRPPFDGSNACALAMRINAGRFARIPNKYSDALFEAIRSMLQLDPRKRPRVEDLEILSAIQPAMNAARSLSSDYKQQQQFASKWRELKVKEDSLSEREAAVLAKESTLREKEDRLQRWEQQLQAIAATVPSTTTQGVQQTTAAEHLSAVTAAVPMPPPRSTTSTTAAARTRLSLGRCTEMMSVDEDALAEPSSDSSNNSSGENTLLLPTPRAYIGTEESSRATPAYLTRPLPGPSTAAVSALPPKQPAPARFQIFNDFPVPPPQPRSVHRIGAVVGSSAPVPPVPTAAAPLARPAMLVTGSEYSKENQTATPFSAHLQPAMMKYRNKEAIYRKIGAGPALSTATSVHAGGYTGTDKGGYTAAARRPLSDLPTGLTLQTPTDTDNAMEQLGSPLKKQRMQYANKTDTAVTAASNATATVHVDLQTLLRRR